MSVSGIFFFFSSRRRHTRFDCDWSSDVCSSDLRANAARRLMQENGVRPDQISQVRGFADQMLRKSNDPQDPSNRRISLIVQYINKDEQQPENAKAGEGKAPNATSKEH